MTGHRWSGWPGAWCLDCGAEDANELCLAMHDTAIECVEGHSMCTEHAAAVCPEHRNGPCLSPGARLADPYREGAERKMDEQEQETAPHRFELTVHWTDFVDAETGEPIKAVGPWRSVVIAIGEPFRGSYGECAIKANEILAALVPVPFRWVPLFGVCPALVVRIDGVASDG